MRLSKTSMFCVDIVKGMFHNETALVDRLARVFAARLCNKYTQFIYRLNI